MDAGFVLIVVIVNVANPMSAHRKSKVGSKLDLDLSLREFAERENIPYGRLQARHFRGQSNSEILNPANIKEDRTKLFRNNTSGVRGVSWDSKKDKWKVAFKHKGKVYFLGRYEKLEQAKSVLENKLKELQLLK